MEASLAKIRVPLFKEENVFVATIARLCGVWVGVVSSRPNWILCLSLNKHSFLA
jgi:hypothetical protein